MSMKKKKTDYSWKFNLRYRSKTRSKSRKQDTSNTKKQLDTSDESSSCKEERFIRIAFNYFRLFQSNFQLLLIIIKKRNETKYMIFRVRLLFQIYALPDMKIKDLSQKSNKILIVAFLF